METTRKYLEKMVELTGSALARVGEGKMSAARLQIFTPQDLRAWLEALDFAYEAALELERLQTEERREATLRDRYMSREEQ